ncbi:MAG: hypothetical protein NVS3B2_04550 [Ramlibacter sp.]
MQPGIHSGLDHDTYRAAPGLSVSWLKAFAACPAKARYGTPRRETPALLRGTATHCALLEPHDLERRFAPTDLDRTGTRAWDAAEVQGAGRRLIKRPEYETALRMRDAVLRHPIAAQLLGPGNSLDVEASFWWEDPGTGALCKARADVVQHSYGVLADVKTAQDASPRGFADAVARFRYDWQCTFYMDGFGRAGGFTPEAFVFIAVESEAPHLVATYELDPADMEQARAQVRVQLERHAECERTDTWPGYPDDLQVLQLPSWASNR